MLYVEMFMGEVSWVYEWGESATFGEQGGPEFQTQFSSWSVCFLLENGQMFNILSEIWEVSF